MTKETENLAPDKNLTRMNHGGLPDEICVMHFYRSYPILLKKNYAFNIHRKSLRARNFVDDEAIEDNTWMSEENDDDKDDEEEEEEEDENDRGND